MPKLLFKEKYLENEYYALYRIQLESFLGIRIFGLMSEPKIEHKANTAIIFQHGGGDSPEITFGLLDDNVYKATADYISKKESLFLPHNYYYGINPNMEPLLKEKIGMLLTKN